MNRASELLGQKFFRTGGADCWLEAGETLQLLCLQCVPYLGLCAIRIP
jgi:hypothetical protein